MIGRGYPADRIATVPLGINVSRFDVTTDEQRRQAKAQLLGVSDRTFVLVDVSRVDGQKRPHLVPQTVQYLVKQLAEVPPSERDFDSILALLVGDGPLRTAVEEGIAQYGLEDSVKVVGTVRDPERYLQAADVFFLPTFNEAMSLAVAEGMARGLPVVTTRVGGLVDLVGSHGNTTTMAIAGRLVPITEDEDVDSLGYSNALLELATNTTARLEAAHGAATLVRDIFDQDVTLLGFVRERETALQTRRKIPRARHASPNPSTTFGLLYIETDDRLTSEVSVVQSRMREEGRLTGQAGILQAKCSDASEAVNTWVQKVVHPKACNPDEEIPVEALFRSAREQCGGCSSQSERDSADRSGCVFDLRYDWKSEEGKGGFLFNGDCWRYQSPMNNECARGGEAAI